MKEKVSKHSQTIRRKTKPRFKSDWKWKTIKLPTYTPDKIDVQDVEALTLLKLVGLLVILLLLSVLDLGKQKNEKNE